MKRIVGSTYHRMHRVLDMLCLGFSHDHIPTYSLHVQTQWRLIHDHQIILASGDMYIPYSDAHPDAVGGFTDTAGDFLLEVNFPDELLKKIPEDKREAAIGVLSHDPRPSYQRQSGRIYGLTFAGYDIRFTIENNTLTVTAVDAV